MGENHEEHHLERIENRRSRNLTDEDVEAIASAIFSKQNDHPCRFARIDPEILEEACKFYQKMNKIMDDSKGIVAKTILVLLVTAICGIMFSGAVTELIKKIPK